MGKKEESRPVSLPWHTISTTFHSFLSSETRILTRQKSLLSFSLCFDSTDLFPRGPPLAQTHHRFPVICGICMRPDRHTDGLIHQFFQLSMPSSRLVSRPHAAPRDSTGEISQNTEGHRETAHESISFIFLQIYKRFDISISTKAPSSFCACCLQWVLVSPRFKNSRFKRSVGVFHRRKEQWWLWFNSTNYFKYNHTSEAFFEYSVQMYYTMY